MAKGGGLRRVGIGIADQGLYSLANFALTVIVARSTDTREFGTFALVSATYLIVSAVTRGLTSETFVVRYSDRVGGGDGAQDPSGRWRWGASAAAGTGLAVGVLVGVVALVIGLVVLHGTTGATVAVFGALLPGLLAQDFYRYAALALGRPTLALWNDVVTIGVQFGVSAALIATSHASVVTLVAAWGGASWIGAVAGRFLLGFSPRPDRIWYWFDRHRDLAVRYVVDDAANQSSQFNSFVVAAVGGVAESGALRAAQTVFGPPSIANMSIMVAATPELVRVLRRSPRRFRRFVGLLSLSQAGLALVWGAAALLAPTPVGRALFGVTWINAQPLLVALAIGQLGVGFRVGPMAGLRALGDAKRTLRARGVVTTMVFGATTIAAAVDGAYGVAIATAVVNPIQAGIWWYHFRKAIARYEPPEGAAADTTQPRAAAARGQHQRR